MNDPVQERHFHWEFTAFNKADLVDNPAGVRVSWPVTVHVLGFMSEEDARLAAADLVQREEFHLSKVWECNTCGYQSAMIANIKKMAE